MLIKIIFLKSVKSVLKKGVKYIFLNFKFKYLGGEIRQYCQAILIFNSQKDVMVRTPPSTLNHLVSFIWVDLSRTPASLRQVR